MAAKKDPTYRLHRPTKQAFIELCGRRHYLGLHEDYGGTESRAKYRRMLQEWKAEGRNPLATPDITVVELVARWYQHARIHYRGPSGKTTSSLHAFRAALRFLLDLYREAQASSFGSLALQACRDKMIEEGLSRNTINKNVRLIRQVFRHGVAQQLIPPHVLTSLSAVSGLQALRTMARETSPILPVPPATVAATLPHLPPAVRVMVQVEALTGARPGEICILRPCDVDMSGDVWEYRPQYHKTSHHGKGRTILIGPRAQDLIRPWLPPSTTDYVFSPARSEAERRAAVHAERVAACEEIERTYAPSERKAAYKKHHVARLSCGNVPGSNVVTRPARKPQDRYTTASYRRAVTNACAKAFPVPADVTDAAERAAWVKGHQWAPNQLRHSFGTMTRKAGGVDVSQTLLGHSKMDTTLLYAEVNFEKAAAVMRQVG